MVDIFTKKKRSEVMSKVKNKGSKIENSFAKILRKNDFSYTRNSIKYFGKPDFVLKKHRTVIFIDSCFWHGCKKHKPLPVTNKIFWKDKIEGNKKRDGQVSKYYKKQEWNILRVWEHEIKKNKNIKFINKILKIKSK